MDWRALIGALAFVTLILWIVIAQVSKRKVEERMDDPNAPKSTLAKDVPSNGTPPDV